MTVEDSTQINQIPACGLQPGERGNRLVHKSTLELEDNFDPNTLTTEQKHTFSRKMFKCVGCMLSENSCPGIDFIRAFSEQRTSLKIVGARPQPIVT